MFSQPGGQWASSLDKHNDDWDKLGRFPKSCCQLQVMKITTIVRFGVAALAMGAFFGVGLPVKADQLVWVRAQPLNYFKVRGLVPPGSYFHNENQKPATIAVNKAGLGVVDQKQTASKTAKKSTQHVRSAKKNSSS
jgi:hypothetical protein